MKIEFKDSLGALLDLEAIYNNEDDVKTAFVELCTLGMVQDAFTEYHNLKESPEYAEEKKRRAEKLAEIREKMNAKS